MISQYLPKKPHFCLISFFFFLVFVVLPTPPVLSQANIFPSLPDWESLAQGQYATGLGIADINGDSWDDIVVANGNDMARQKLYVYYNNGDGTFPQTPSWMSSDIDYLGHLSVGDINQDGLIDVAVSSFLGPDRFADPGYIKVYSNLGGYLEPNPSFRSADSMYNFSCALGDADGDGDLDLAVACGEPYSGITDYGKIYYNQNGQLDSLPGWTSSVVMGAMDVDFADMDNNGFLDLIFACHLTPNYIYLADSTGAILQQPSWQSQDNSYYANSLTIAKVDDNNYPDLMVSDNFQLGGQGKFKAYLFNNLPSLSTSPAWFSNTGGYGSAVLAEDINGDNFPDLFAGRWWGNVQIYPGDGSSFNPNPGWQSASSSVIEAFALRDLDQDGRMNIQETISVNRDSVHVFYLNEPAVEKVNTVQLNGVMLTAGTDYTIMPGVQWISTESPLMIGDQIEVNYTISHDRDLIVTNWDTNKGNYIFYNMSNPTGITSVTSQGESEIISVYPNPFNSRCKFLIQLKQRSKVRLEIFDVTGRSIKTVYNSEANPGKLAIFWNGTGNSNRNVGSGMYFYQLQINDRISSGRLLLMK
jgi:hypothetical protein